MTRARVGLAVALLLLSVISLGGRPSRPPLFLAHGAAAVALGATPASQPATRPAGQNGRPGFGLWYTCWWTADDQFRHWVNCPRLPVRGRYTAGDPKVIAEDYALFRELGVDFIVMDDTNCAGNDGGRINDNIRAWFDFMDRQPLEQQIPICIGGGGEIRGEGSKGQTRAADFYWQAWAQRPSYFMLGGKPLLIVDTDDNYGPGDWDDPRFAVRWAYNGDNHESMGRLKTWGWGSCHPAPVVAESMSIWPGHRFPYHVAKLGNDPLEEPRDGGDLYARAWLHVLKSNPRYVTLADFNNFEEETAIEASYSWEDPRGYAVPDLYIRITRAYSRLRTEQLVKGECYRDENRPEVYLFDGQALVHQGGMPLRATVIVTPAGLLDRIAKAQGFAVRPRK